MTPFELVELNDLVIKKEINEHGRLYFTGLVPEEVKDEYVVRADFGKPVQVFQNKDGEAETIFCGIICDIEIRMFNGVYYMTVNAITSTYLMDIEIKRRSFQDNSMTYSELVKKITNEYGGGVSFIPNDRALGEFVIQYKETDWSFVMRMASRFHEGLYPNFESPKVKYSFGTPKFGRTIELDEFPFSIKKRLADYQFMKANHIPDTHHLDYVSYEVETYQQLRLGEGVLYKDYTFYVQSAEMRMQDGVLRSLYRLSTKGGLKQKFVLNRQLQGAAITGHVIDIQRDQVKVHMHEIDDSQDVGTAHWFPFSAMYASEDGSGWYCMPELEDDVRIEFPNSQDGEAFAVSSVSKYDPQTPDARQDRMGDPEVRYIRNPQGMEVILTPKEVIISANETGIIVLDEEGKISIHADQQLAFKSDEEISLYAQETINITAETGINIKCGELAEIKMNEDGITRIKGNEIFTN